MEDGLMKIIESLAKKKKMVLSRDEFKSLKRCRTDLLDRIEATEGVAEGFRKWYDSWKDRLTLPNQAILQLNAVFGEKK